jgi:hypothetical protein
MITAPGNDHLLDKCIIFDTFQAALNVILMISVGSA